jgi:transcription elongation factor GreA
MENYLTPDGLKKLKTELDYLKKVKRKEISEKLNHSISFGDLSENAAYDEAKEEQGFLEGRISELNDIVSHAKIINKKQTNKISIGSIVLVSLDHQKEKYQIVGPEEADIFNGKISYQSPLGKTLLNKTIGDKAMVETPSGKIEYRIIEVS